MSAPFPFQAGDQFVLWRPAGMISVPGKGSVTQRFRADAWASRIGQVTLLYFRGEPAATGKLVSAVVAEDGSGVNLTYEILGMAALRRCSFMDPDKTLALARTMVRIWEEAANHDAEHAAARELSSAFAALDDFLSHGGALPVPWQGGREEVSVLALVREFALAADDALAAEDGVTAAAREHIVNRLLWGHPDGPAGIRREAAGEDEGMTLTSAEAEQLSAATGTTLWHLMTGNPVAPELAHPVFGGDLREIDPGQMDENAHPLIATCLCGEEITRDAPDQEWGHTNPEL